jgi:hypothetical protein
MTATPEPPLQSYVSGSPLLRPILDEWNRIGLPDCWLAAGAIAQTVWNHEFGFPPTHSINDIDIVYFDANNFSETAEVDHSARVRQLFSGLPVWIDVKNEARVYLWYEAKFGRKIDPYASATDAISTFPTTATAVGIRTNDHLFEFCAPYGLSDLLGVVVRPNKKQITRDVYERKVNR